jgi:hypothetical protein
MRKFEKFLINYFLPIGLILVLSFSRLIPHPSNFTPMLAVGVFSGFYFRNFLLAALIVIFSMFLGDLYLGFHDTMFFTYISLAIAVALGLLIKRLKFTEVLFSGLASSACFFLVTNFGAWIVLDMYEKNLAGLIKSYVLAVPFFHNTLISTFFYLILLKLLFEFTTKKNIIKTSF